jgi:hypothetical protein
VDVSMHPIHHNMLFKVTVLHLMDSAAHTVSDGFLMVSRMGVGETPSQIQSGGNLLP